MDTRTAVGDDRSGQTKPVGFWEAFWFWVKLGFINFGGPAGQIAIMHRELVERKRWVSEGQYLRKLNFCMLLPGPEAQQVATYIGWRLHGTLGGLVAGSFFVIPSVFVLWLLSYLAAAQLKTLTPVHVRALYREKLDAGLAPRTVQYVHVTLQKALSQAVADGLIPRNAAAPVKAPRPVKKEIRPLSPEQARAFLEAARGGRFEALYVLAVHCGLRE